MTVILETIHGSHLYGLAHENSDEDFFRVVRGGSGRTKHRITEDLDYVEMPLDTFLANVFKGSHQSCEALFSRHAVIHPEYREFFASIRVTGEDVFNRYRRTIHAFSYGDDKRRRHAVRLGFNLRDLRMTGRFDPTLTEDQKNKVLVVSQLYRGQSLYDIAINL